MTLLYGDGQLPDAPEATQGWAKLVNMDLALRTLLAAVHAEEGSPRLALFTGPSGYGKTVASGFAATQTDAAYIRATSLMMRKQLLEMIARELGIAPQPRRTMAQVMDDIIEQLAREPRPLIVDEFDFIVDRGLVEVIRDIHDQANVPILMVGEEAMPARLKQWQRFDNRIIAATLAEPCSIEDGRLLRDLYCRRAQVADDLVDYIVERCTGITRRVVVNLQAAQNCAIDELDGMIDRKAWGNRPVLDGSVQVRRARGLR